MSKRQGDDEKVVATNRKARHDYAIEETFEAGLVLLGSEVKSLRDGRVTLGEGYIMADRDELWLVGIHIHEYPWANIHNHDPTRRRKLLMHRREIDRITDRIEQKGFAAIALRIYFKSGRAKLEFGLGKGKRSHDKRQDLKERDAKREIARAMRH